MADEKDKIASDFIKAAGNKSDAPETPASRAMREYLDTLLKAASTTPDAELSALIKELAERGKPFSSAEQLSNLLALLDPKGAAQKKAAETNQVDEGAANEWFREHWKDRKCAICKEVTWAMAPEFAHVPLARIRIGQVGGAFVRSFPSVVLTCRVCGNTLFFNANVMKLLPEGSE